MPTSRRDASGILGYVMPGRRILIFFFFKAKMIPAGCSTEITRAMQLLFQSRRFYEVGTAPYVHRRLLSGVRLALQEV